MSKVNIGDVCEILSGYAFDSKLFTDNHNDKPLVRIRDVVRGFTQTYTTEEYDDKYIVKKGDLLIGMDGEFNIALWNSENALLNQRVCKIKSVSDRLDEKYLLHFMPSALKEIERMTSFVTVKHLSVKTINQIEIPLPPLDVQKHIANTLDKAQEIIDGHKKQLEELDYLIKAIFYDMFGNPITNTKKWPEKIFTDILVLQRGFDLPVKARNPNGNIDVYGSNGILDKHSECKIERGGIITGRSGTIGKVYYTFKKYWPLNTTLFSKEYYDNNIVYLAYFLEYFDLKRFCAGTGVPTLNRNIVHSEKIINVPLELQNKFAEIVTNIEEQKSLVKQSITESQNLFNSLMSKYFD